MLHEESQSSNKPWESDAQIANLIANLRGLPEKGGRARMRGTNQVGALLESLVASGKLNFSQSAQETIHAHWARIVGSEYAQRSAPERILNDKTLIIRIENPTLRQQMSFQRVKILKNLRAYTGSSKIQQLVFRIG